MMLYDTIRNEGAMQKAAGEHLNPKWAALGSGLGAGWLSSIIKSVHDGESLKRGIGRAGLGALTSIPANIGALSGLGYLVGGPLSAYLGYKGDKWYDNMLDARDASRQ